MVVYTGLDELQQLIGSIRRMLHVEGFSCPVYQAECVTYRQHCTLRPYDVKKAWNSDAKRSAYASYESRRNTTDYKRWRIGMEALYAFNVV
jgi:hypothetical protein